MAERMTGEEFICSVKYLNMCTVSLSRTEIGCLLEHDRVKVLSQRLIVCNCTSMRLLMCVQSPMSDQLHTHALFWRPESLTPLDGARILVSVSVLSISQPYSSVLVTLPLFHTCSTL